MQRTTDPEAATLAAASSPDPELGQRAVAALHGLLEVLEALQVDNARANGWSWQDIASRLGVTKQAVHQNTAPAAAPSKRDRKAAMEPIPRPVDVTRPAGHASGLARMEARRLGHQYRTCCSGCWVMPRTRWRPTWRPRTDANVSCSGSLTTAPTRSGCWSRPEDSPWTSCAPPCSTNSTKASDTRALTHMSAVLSGLSAGGATP